MRLCCTWVHAVLEFTLWVHALIESIDISIAEKLPGVKSIITFKDFIKINPDNKYNETLENCIANEKVLYDGHAVAAVAAVDLNTAKKAIKSINVKFKKLPFVINIEDAMKKEAPLVAKGKKKWEYTRWIFG